MRRLTVVQLLPALEAGGVERSTLEIADALVRAGHRAIVVSAGGRLLAQIEALGAEHVVLDIGRKSPLTLRHVPALRRLLREVDADIVHARSRLPAWLGWLALRGMRGRAAQRPPASGPPASRPHFVTTAHGLNSPSPYSAIMTRGEFVICVSQTVRDYLLQHYPTTDPTRLVVIPRGIDPAAFPPVAWPDHAGRARFASLHPPLGGSGPLLLLPGRGTRLKGHADAIALLANLRAGGLDARLWMPGAVQDGREAYLAELDAMAVAAGVEDALAMTEPTADIAAAYAASDLVLQLSRKPESFGRTVIEALSVGRPVLGWAHGGVGESLRALQPRGAVTPFDAALLAKTARTLLAQAPLADGTIPAMTMPHTLRTMQESTLALYQSLVDA